jgi:Zn-dependent protease
MPSVLELVQTLAVWALPVLLALTGHAIAMAQVAWRLGDRSEALRERLSWNPITHVDPVGTLLVPGLLAVMGGFLIGWPRTVPVNAGAFRHPRKDLALVALAAVGANLVMAVAWTVLLKVALGQDVESGLWIGLRLTAMAGVTINLVLMLFGLLPVPGFAGGHVVGALLPPAQAYKWYAAQQWSFIVVLVLLVSGVLSAVLIPPMQAMQGLLFGLAGIAA